MKFFHLALAGSVVLGFPAYAQVSPSTPADVAGVPAQFLPNSKVGPGGFAPKSTPAGYKVNPDPRDFTGSYVNGEGGAPPGGAPPGRGGPPPSGPPPGGSTLPANASAACLPTFGGGAYPVHLISSPGRLTYVEEENHRLRRIYIGGAHPADAQPSFGGDSVGHWDGNTLVIDTVDIEGRDGAHLLERWTRQPDGSIAIVTSNLDAKGKAIGAPTDSTLVWRPDLSFVEDICEDYGEAFGAGYGGGK